METESDSDDNKSPPPATAASPPPATTAPDQQPPLSKRAQKKLLKQQRCETPAHLWLAGYQGEMQNLLEKTPGYDKWLIEKESRPYIEAFQDQKENLVYLTADSENVLDELDPKKVYIIGGLVDRNRWKGITMNKAKEQGIQTAKLPIGNYLKMSSSQVLTVNQVVEILLKFLELRDWKASFFEVIPQRKRCEADSEDVHDEPEGEDNEQEQGDDHQDMKRQCIEGKPLSNPV
nr:tRNA (guanine(9)-N1)-methyltransferase isoform X3 [Ipomoea trifida]